MLRNIVIYLLLLVALLIASCNKLDTNPGGDNNGPDPNPQPGDTGIPYTFRWSTTRVVNLTIGMVLPAQPDLCRADVYERDPDAGGARLLSGAVSNGSPFTASHRITGTLTQLFLVLRTPDGIIRKAAVGVSENISYTFQEALLSTGGEAGGERDNTSAADSDGDGIADLLDDFPADASRAFTSIYPASGRFGTLAFEDLWPSEGDHDMNDLVVNYKITRITSNSNFVVEMPMQFFVRAVGGGLRNGLAIQLDQFTPDKIAMVSGSSLAQQYLILNANNTEANQSRAVIPIFEDCNDIIHRVGGEFFNTANNGKYGTWDTLQVMVQFMDNNITLSMLQPPFNPFIIKGMNRDFEIHLPDFPPTDLASTTYFGMHDDDSRPSANRYYKTHKNLPWGLDFPESFSYPFENVAVTSAYLHLYSWARSGGSNYSDWYYNTAEGYRDNSKLYH